MRRDHRADIRRQRKCAVDQLVDHGELQVGDRAVPCAIVDSRVMAAEARPAIPRLHVRNDALIEMRSVGL